MLGRARVGRDWQSAIPPLRRACFNPRARVGRDTWNRPCRRVYQSFNPRARVGRDSASAFSSLRQSVSIHAPAWGATLPPMPIMLASVFQSTRPRGARRTVGHPTQRDIQGFNPRARVGRDGIVSKLKAEPFVVSIHAPAWGATINQLPQFLLCNSFNPRARVGRDFPVWLSSLAGQRFQSTRPRGARRDAETARDGVQPVSIHAPAWGATSSSFFSSLRVVVSIHAPAWGATYVCGVLVHLNRFQSTRPRGARPSRHRSQSASRQFQSTRPRGARPERPSRKCCGYMFQSTRPRGARRVASSMIIAVRCGFNPRARVGRDEWNDKTLVEEIEFQSTRPRGARRSDPCPDEQRRQFQSTRPRGARQRELWKI